MKLQIDFDNKIIKLEDNANLGEFIEKIEKLFPEGEWKEFKLETNVTISGGTTWIPYYPTYPYYPWNTSPWITYGTSEGTTVGESWAINTTACSGNLNIEL